MYESFFGLHEKPFTLLPDPSFFYPSKIHQEALTLVEYGLQNQTGFTILTGEIGSGKTTLMRYLLDQLGEDVTVGLISHTHHSLGEIMDWVCAAFELNIGESGKIARHQAFVDFLIAQYAKGQRTLLIVDEAQNLGIDKLEEIRLLSNINADKDLILQLLLIGQPQLRQQLREPELEQFIQRVSASYHLGRLTSEETYRYIRHRLKIAGGSKNIFSADACHAAFHYSGGIPRIINLICETALVHAYGAGEKIITGAIVDEFVKTQASHLLIALEQEERTPLPESSDPPLDEDEAENETADSLSDETAASSVTSESARDLTETSAESSPANEQPAASSARPSPAPIQTTPREASQLDEAPEMPEANGMPAKPLSDDPIETPLDINGILRKWSSELIALSAALVIGLSLAFWYGFGDSNQTRETAATASPEPAATTRAPSDEASLPPLANESRNVLNDASESAGAREAAPDEMAAEAHGDEARPPASNLDERPASHTENALTSETEDTAQPGTNIETDPAPGAIAEIETRTGMETPLDPVDSQPSTPPAQASLPETSPRIGQLADNTPRSTADTPPDTAPIASQRMVELERKLSKLPLSIERTGNNQLKTDFAKLVQFKDGSINLDAASQAMLKSFADLLREYDHVQATVTAHTDSSGNSEFNRRLSLKRADAVADFLENQGIPSDRVAREGKGESELKFAPEQEKLLGPWINRRIEINLNEIQPL